MLALVSAWAARDPIYRKSPNIGDRFIEDAVVWQLRVSGGLTEEFHFFCSRNDLKPEHLAVINKCRALILCGSTMFHRDFWPKRVKLVRNLASIKVPIVSFGCGWGGRLSETEYQFRPKARQALARLARNFPMLSVRDAPTKRLIEQQVPKAQGRVHLTGCPVLFRYNSGVFDPVGLSGGPGKFEPRRILFSSNERFHLREHHDLLRRLLDLFPEAEITIALNEESDEFTSTLSHCPRVRIFSSRRVEDYYEVLDSHDFQIGFRLHNHMYFLSRCKPTLTVEVDGRTSGFAETFAQTNLKIEEIAQLDHLGIRVLLQENASHLPATAAPRWTEMKRLIEAIGNLPHAVGPGFVKRLFYRFCFPIDGGESQVRKQGIQICQRAE
ncbi:MAG: polysaccharide pyruvyl transferase family protein [bacterium]